MKDYPTYVLINCRRTYLFPSLSYTKIPYKQNPHDKTMHILLFINYIYYLYKIEFYFFLNMEYFCTQKILKIPTCMQAERQSY